MNLDFDNYTLTGNITINIPTDTGRIDFDGIATPYSIIGDITIKAPNSTVNNNVNVSGSTTLNGVAFSSYNATGTHGRGIRMNGKGRLNLSEKANTTEITVETSEKVKLAGNIKKVKIEQENQNIELEENTNITEPIEVNKDATIISTQPVIATVNSNIDITFKADEADEGLTVKGTGEQLVPINPKEISDILAGFHDGMFDGILYEGKGNIADEKYPYTLSRMVSDKVLEVSDNASAEIILSVGNNFDGEDIEYGYYRIKLTIAGVTKEKDIKVDTITTNSTGFKDALKFNINKIILKENISVGSFELKELRKLNEIKIDYNGFIIENYNDGIASLAKVPQNALEYNHDGYDYKFRRVSHKEDNIYEFEYDSTIGDIAETVKGDWEYYLKALYLGDIVKSIEYNGGKYTWNNSDWSNDTTSLIDIMETPFEGTGYIFKLKDVNENSMDLVLRYNILNK